jgi:hypothetical protein
MPGSTRRAKKAVSQLDGGWQGSESDGTGLKNRGIGYQGSETAGTRTAIPQGE